MYKRQQQDNGYLVFLDMDNLKKTNDIYGHKAGDRALKLFGSLLMEHAQHSVVCRLGGEMCIRDRHGIVCSFHVRSTDRPAVII